MLTFSRRSLFGVAVGAAAAPVIRGTSDPLPAIIGRRTEVLTLQLDTSCIRGPIREVMGQIEATIGDDCWKRAEVFREIMSKAQAECDDDMPYWGA